MFSGKEWTVFGVSCLVVALAQPSLWGWLGPLAAAGGYAGGWITIARQRSAWRRFWLGSLWMAVVQGVQWSWFLHHQYRGVAIGLAYLFIIALWGAQHGLFCVILGRFALSRIASWLALAGIWTVMEWSRQYLFSGSAWNPAGLALTHYEWSLQAASIFGVLGLSFWVVCSNGLLVRSWCRGWQWRSVALWALAVSVPYGYGVGQLAYHGPRLQKAVNEERLLRVALVQTAQPPTDCLPREDRADLFNYAQRQWEEALADLQELNSRSVDLVVFPEAALPFGTYLGAYMQEQVDHCLVTQLGEGSLDVTPPLEKPWGKAMIWEGENLALVSNAYWAQSIANWLNSEVIIGLDYGLRQEEGEGNAHFNSARHFKPRAAPGERYDKRVLVPMGEYVPFSWVGPLAARYGVTGSFDFGKTASPFVGAKANYGVSICYEETFGHITRASRLQGADLLVNLTSDAWFPHSTLPKQHYHHALVRTVESGVPLVRACNTGVTCAINSLGKTVATFGNESGPHEWTRGVLYAEVPLYSYLTLYTLWGDWGILCLSLFGIGGGFLTRSRRPQTGTERSV